jgi:radical SAM superfamily enzyme YgiQ (UPF0313 family)
MKIKLILAAAADDPLKFRDPFMPLSLPLLAGAAPEHDYELIDMLWASDRIDFNAPVDLVGISVRVTAEARAFAIADDFRRRGVTVVLGGPQASLAPLRAIAHADAVVVGEGEPLWPVVLADAAAKRLKNFYVASPAKFDAPSYTVYQVDEFPDLAQVPTPRRDLFKRRYRFDTVFAVRGCPLDCEFCSVTELFGSQCRRRPVDAVASEIAGFKGFYYLLDDTVFGRLDTYDYYLDLYAAIARLPKKRYWTGQANLDAVASDKGRAVIRQAARAGLLYAMVGLESINPAVLEKSGALRKSGSRDAAEAVARMEEHIAFLQDLGIVLSGWFVVGYEDDTIDTFYETFEFCRRNRLLPVLSPLKVLPGTRLHARLAAEGRLNQTARPDGVRHPTLRDGQILAALEHAVREGYSTAENLRRARFYWRKFSPQLGNTLHDRTFKFIFTMILQSRLPKILRTENENLFK